MHENAGNISQELLTEAKGFGLSVDETQKFCEQLGRLPSREEVAVTGALWSEHCSYKSSKIHLRRFHSYEEWVLEGPGENAGVVRLTPNWAIAFKMESHNHPSYIEPFQGAATGVGGILRDVFCMGARPIANVNCLRFGEGEYNAHLLKHTVKGIGDYGNSVGVPTLTGDTAFHTSYSKNILVNAFTAGLIHKDHIFKGVLTTEKNIFEQSFSISHKSYQNGETLSTESRKELFPESENVLIYFGSATGRDGVHGATMSSSEFSGAGKSLKPTVQVGDPFAEKVLIEATLKLIAAGVCVGLQDMGAAGLTSSSVEMAGRSGCGVAIDLNAVPQRAANMQPWEILLSESQERMLAAVTPENVATVMELLKSFDLSAAVVGRVNHTGKFICTFDEKICTVLPITLLVDDIPRYSWPLCDKNEYLEKHRIIKNRAVLFTEEIPTQKSKIALNGENLKIHEAIMAGETLKGLLQIGPKFLCDLLGHVSFASREPLFSQYDSTVGGNTVAGVGALRSAAAGVLRIPEYAREKDSEFVGIAVAGGCEERWVEHDPFVGSAFSALKIARKIVASGAVPLAMTDCLNFGSPRSPEVMRQISDAVDGLNAVALKLKIPVVSGNVSLNNQTDGEPIPPTPMLGMVGRTSDVRKTPQASLPKYKNFGGKTPEFTEIFQLSFKNPESVSSFECSEVSWILGGQSEGPLPGLDLEREKQLWEAVLSIVEKFSPSLCVPVGQGGVALSLFRMAVSSDAHLFVSSQNFLSVPAKTLFSEGNMGFLVGFSRESLSGNVRHSAEHLRIPKFLEWKMLGILQNTSDAIVVKGTKKPPELVLGDLHYFEMNQLKAHWKSGLKRFF